MEKEQKLWSKKGDNGKWGFVDENGNWVIEPKFDDAWDFNDGFAKVKINRKFGFIKNDGIYLVEPKFDDAWDFNDGFAKIKLNKKYGFIKTDGTYLVEPKFDEADDFDEGEATVIYDNLYRKLLSDGSFKKQSEIEEYLLNCREIQYRFSEGFSFLETFKNDGKWTFDSWSRNISDNEDWYYACDNGVYEGVDIARYNDEIYHRKTFAKWANSLKLSKPEEVGALLWANAQILIDLLHNSEDGAYGIEELQKLSILLLLYNQLENIKKLDLMEIRNSLNLPKEVKYLNIEKVEKEAIKLCKELVDKENGFEFLDFSELLELSRTPGNHKLISSYDFKIIEDYEDGEDEA